jgi:hypothetical protein
MGNAAGSSLRTLAGWGARTPETLAAALEFIHTNNCSNPISMRLSGRLRAVCIHRNTGAESPQKPRSRHGFRPLQLQLRWCVT